MNNRNTSYSRNSIYALFLLLVITGCSTENSTSVPVVERDLSLAYSVIINEEDLFISGLENINNEYSTRYWINNEVVDSTTFVDGLESGNGYRGAVDSRFRQTFVHKSPEGLNEYRFWQGGLGAEQQLSYIKNNTRKSLDTTALGIITAVDLSSNEEIFAGWFGEEVSTEAGPVLAPKLPFYWHYNYGFTLLELPETNYFNGVSFIKEYEDDIYTGGLIGKAMYWENAEPIILSDLYGEVRQVQIINGNVYAVGFYNKSNSNSAGHTACYWVNGELQELEDNAQAYGIFVDGDDIYVTGATGRVPVEYKACYWKNGVRVDLP